MSTFLSKREVNRLLIMVKVTLEKEGYLIPIAFVAMQNGTNFAIDLHKLMKAKNFQQKKQYVSSIGQYLKTRGGVKEALMLLEGWFVDVKKTPSALQVAPSKHPLRQEAIVVIGRNAKNTRTTSVIQPFTRDKKNRPLWKETTFVHYNKPVSAGPVPSGLIDYLFVQ